MPVIKVPDYSQYFLIGLHPPQSVAIAVQKLKGIYAAQGTITAPFPILPVLHSCSPPSPPVPGLLPVCTQVITVGSSLAIAPDGGWLTLPVDAGEWLFNLGRHFPSTGKNTLPGEVYPVCTGIPIAWLSSIPPGSVLSAQLMDILPCSIGWRALNLVCYEINFSRSRPWFMAVHWREMWRRRLRRAPRTAANDKAALAVGTE